MGVMEFNLLMGVLFDNKFLIMCCWASDGIIFIGGLKEYDYFGWEFFEVIKCYFYLEDINFFFYVLG